MAIKSSLSSQQARIGQFFKWLPLHPNDLTLLSVAFAAAGAWFVWQQSVWGPVLFLLSFALDGLDGAVARAKNLVSPFGAYLDGVCDRLVEFFALLPFLLAPLAASAPALLAGFLPYGALPAPPAGLFLPALITLFFGSCMTAFSKAYADHRQVCDAKTAAKLSTLMPRTERVIGLWVALILFIYSRFDLLIPLLWLLAAGSILSFIWLQYGAWRASERH